MKRKLLSLLLVLIIICSIVPTTHAANHLQLKAADALYNLGLFSGTGIDKDGNPIYELDRAPTRHEAVTMLVRLLGKEEEAKAGKWNVPFTDVAEWAKPYVGYAYAHGLTSGTSATTYSGDKTVTATQYLTFVLRALGYDSNVDFQWDKAWLFSDEIHLTFGQYNENSSFTRGDAALVSYCALNVYMKDGSGTLSTSLGISMREYYFGDIETHQALQGYYCEKINGISYDMVPDAIVCYHFDGFNYEITYKIVDDDIGVIRAWYEYGTFTITNGSDINFVPKRLVTYDRTKDKSEYCDVPSPYQQSLAFVSHAYSKPMIKITIDDSDFGNRFKFGTMEGCFLSDDDSAHSTMFETKQFIVDRLKYTILDSDLDYCYRASCNIIKETYNSAEIFCCYVLPFVNINTDKCVVTAVSYDLGNGETEAEFMYFNLATDETIVDINGLEDAIPEKHDTPLVVHDLYLSINILQHGKIAGTAMVDILTGNGNTGNGKAFGNSEFNSYIYQFMVVPNTLRHQVLQAQL